MLLVSSFAFSQWVSLPSGTTNHLNSVFFTDALTGYSAGNGGIILKTIDGGDSWTPLSGGITGDLNAIYFISQDTGYAAGYNGTLLKTTNAGAS
jgi:photosystem II stability/assembly factor-like uncharacterized protein